MSHEITEAAIAKTRKHLGKWSFLVPEEVIVEYLANMYPSEAARAIQEQLEQSYTLEGENE
jgi:hypothetical protein